MTAKTKATLSVGIIMALAALAAAQEIAFLDLTGTTPRVELRHPPSPPPKCNRDGVCGSGGYVGASIACGGATPGELRTSLLSLDRSDYKEGDNAEIEVELQNTGHIPIAIPWTPHLADLQPADDAAKFSVQELQLGLFLNWREGYSISLGWLDLYGDPLQPGTIVTVNPGDRVRVRGQIKITTTHFDGAKLPAVELAYRSSAKALLSEVEFIPHPGGLSERMSNGTPKEVAGVDQPIHVYSVINND
jgi:hypothetical protein